MVAAATTLAVSTLARAQAGGSNLDDKDPPAVELGHQADTNKVDKTMYQICRTKRAEQLRRVLDQALVANLAMPEAMLDDVQRMLDS